jgi:hypothetical protein
MLPAFRQIKAVQASAKFFKYCPALCRLAFGKDGLKRIVDNRFSKDYSLLQ